MVIKSSELIDKESAMVMIGELNGVDVVETKGIKSLLLDLGVYEGEVASITVLGPDVEGIVIVVQGFDHPACGVDDEDFEELMGALHPPAIIFVVDEAFAQITRMAMEVMPPMDGGMYVVASQAEAQQIILELHDLS